MISHLCRYIKSLFHYRTRILGGATPLIILFVIENHFPDIYYEISIVVFVLAFLIAQFLARRELFIMYKCGYSLPKEGVEILESLYAEKKYSKSFDITDKNRYIIKELSEDEYISSDFINIHKSKLTLITKGIKYVEKRLPL